MDLLKTEQKTPLTYCVSDLFSSGSIQYFYKKRMSELVKEERLLIALGRIAHADGRKRKM